MLLRRSRPLSCVLLLMALAGCTLIPEGRTPDDRGSRPPPIASAAGRQCIAQLAGGGARFSALPDQTFGTGCHQYDAVQLMSLGTDTGGIAVSRIGPVTCDTARALQSWAANGVDTAARAILGSPLAQIETMGSYSCRNVAGTGRRSAHSRAEAVDVAAFVLADGRRISVLGDWNGPSRERAAFLREVHGRACGPFATVLGPDYNAAHANHLHLEIGSGRFCR